eukprot:scaffold3838_cov65-Phaeocystis_antarctica.AAC.5
MGLQPLACEKPTLTTMPSVRPWAKSTSDAESTTQHLGLGVDHAAPGHAPPREVASHREVEPPPLLVLMRGGHAEGLGDDGGGGGGVGSDPPANGVPAPRERRPGRARLRSAQLVHGGRDKRGHARLGARAADLQLRALWAVCEAVLGVAAPEVEAQRLWQHRPAPHEEGAVATGRRGAAAESLQHLTGVAPLLCGCSGAKTQSLSALISQRLPERVRESRLAPGMADGGTGAEARLLEGLEDDRAEIGAGQDFGGHT